MATVPAVAQRVVDPRTGIITPPWQQFLSSLSAKTSTANASNTVFDFMTATEIASVQARDFSADVGPSLQNAFQNGVGTMPDGGYFCGSSVVVPVADGLVIRGSESTQVEMRFAAGHDGLSLTYSNPILPPTISGVAITTLQLGPAVAGLGLSVTMFPLVLTAYRDGVAFSDIVVHGADPTLHGWQTCAFVTGLWYPSFTRVSLKGYSAVGAAQNTYETLYGLRIRDCMVPAFATLVEMQHVNDSVYEDGSTLACEGYSFKNFEFVGVRNGFNIGNGVGTPIPGGVIADGHVDCSFRGFILNNRVQSGVNNVLLYRTIATSEAWTGGVVANGVNNTFDNITFENVSANINSCNGLVLAGASSNNTIRGLIASNFNSAGAIVELADTSSNNTIHQASFVSGPAGTPLSGVVFAGGFTGTGNLILDYKEDVFTPTITSSVGTITTVTSVSGVFRKAAGYCYVRVSFNITNNGTGAGTLIIGNLPFAALTDFNGYGRSLSFGFSVMGSTSGGGTSLGVVKYDGTYPGAGAYSISMMMDCAMGS